MKKTHFYMRTFAVLRIIIVIFVAFKLFIYYNEELFQPETFLITYETRRQNYSIIANRNKERWSQLQKKFNAINFNLLINSRDKWNRKNKTLIYKCESYCGGLGDRLRGIVTSFLLALVSDRQFLIDMRYPCDITNFLQPNLYDWTMDYNKTTRNYSSRKIVAIDTNDQIVAEIHDKPFVSNWSQYNDIEIFTNMDFVTAVFSNPWLQHNRILRMFLKVMRTGQANINTLFPLLFEILFKPSKSVSKIIDSALTALSQKQTSLLCLHIRVGQNPTNPNDAAFDDRETIAKDMIEYIDDSALLRWENLTVMVASDSKKAASQILRHFTRRSFTIPGPILHIDRPAKHVDHCEGFFKVVVDFYVLGECHTSFLTNSRFSAFANRRRKTPYKNLYKYDSTGKRVKKCRDILATFKWEPPESINATVYCPSPPKL